MTAKTLSDITLSDAGFLDLDLLRLEYRMIGPRPEAAPTIVMLHEGLGSVGLWGSFPDAVAEATGAGVFVYSRAGYGQSDPVELPRPRPLAVKRTPEFVAYVDRIWRLIEDDVRATVIEERV